MVKKKVFNEKFFERICMAFEREKIYRNIMDGIFGADRPGSVSTQTKHVYRYFERRF